MKLGIVRPDFLPHVAPPPVRSPVQLAALAVSLLVGCSEAVPEPTATAIEPPAPPPAAPAAPVRALREGALLSTPARNLVFDPEFELAADDSIRSSRGFFSWFDDGRSGRLTVTKEARTPGGRPGTFATILDPGAVDGPGKTVSLVTPILGGAGPYESELWVAVRDRDAPPVETASYGALVKVALADLGASDGNAWVAYDLVPDLQSAVTIGDRTWVRYAVRVDKRLEQGGYLAIEAPLPKGRALDFFAPTVLAGPAEGRTAAYRVLAHTETQARPLRATERRAIERHGAIPPRLSPAGAPRLRPRSPRP
jgi:hypothetical protein